MNLWISYCRIIPNHRKHQNQSHLFQILLTRLNGRLMNHLIGLIPLNLLVSEE